MQEIGKGRTGALARKGMVSDVGTPIVRHDGALRVTERCMLLIDDEGPAVYNTDDLHFKSPGQTPVA
jgi:hypothetical protein